VKAKKIFPGKRLSKKIAIQEWSHAFDEIPKPDVLEEIHMKILMALFLILNVVGYGCTRESRLYIELTYHPQYNPVRLKKSENIAFKVKVNDLRAKASNLRMENEVGNSNGEQPNQSGFPIISKDHLGDLTAHAIKTELINRGFRLGERVLIEVDLIKFYFSTGAVPITKLYQRPTASGEIILHIDIIKSNKTIVFSKLIKGRGEYKRPEFKRNEKNQYTPSEPLPKKPIDVVTIALENALKDSISKLINDPEFISSLIKADMR
jgi:hypothetical protein